jgi:Helix-turn-helix domain
MTTATPRDAIPDFGLRERRMPDLLATPALPIADVALYLDIPLSTLDLLRAKGQGPRCFRIGRRLYVLQADLRAWLERMAADEAA